jgi:hypothetical protein
MLNALHEKFLKLCLRTVLININEVQDTTERRINSETTLHAHYSTRNPRSRKVAGSIHGCVIGIFHSLKPFRPHYDPRIDSAYKENEYQEYFLRGKDGRCVWLTTLPTSWAECLEIWESHPPETLRASPGLYRNCFTSIRLLICYPVYRAKRNFVSSLNSVKCTFIQPNMQLYNLKSLDSGVE